MSSKIDLLPFHTFKPELKPEIICQNFVFFGRQGEPARTLYNLLDKGIFCFQVGYALEQRVVFLIAFSQIDRYIVFDFSK